MATSQVLLLRNLETWKHQRPRSDEIFLNAISSFKLRKILYFPKKRDTFDYSDIIFYAKMNENMLF